MAAVSGEIQLITCIYSIGLSSPVSRLAAYLVAGKEFGTRLKSTRRLLFVMVTEAIVTSRRESG